MRMERRQVKNNKNCLSGNRKTHTPGHPRPFGSGSGLSAPVEEMVVYGEETPELKRGPAESPAMLWETVLSLRFGRNSVMTSVSLAPCAWRGGSETWRLWRLAERRVGSR